jgi:transcriptional regulator with XRE-family HTH domain
MKSITIQPRIIRLRKYRKARGLSQAEAARLMGLKSTAALSRWERGNCLPNTSNLLWLAATYHVLVDALVIDTLREMRAKIDKREQRLSKHKHDRPEAN